MRRWALTGAFAGIALALVGVTIGGTAPIGGAAPQGTLRPLAPAASTLTLQGVEIDRAGILLPANWTAAQGSATWSPPWGKAQYSYAFPATIPPAGAPVTLSVTVQAHTNAGFAVAVGFAGETSVEIRNGPARVDAHARAAGETQSASKTVTVVPRSYANGALVRILVGIQDGPRVTYIYKASNRQVCKRPGATSFAATAAEPLQAAQCTATVRFLFTQGGRPSDAGAGVIDIRTVGSGSGTFRYSDKVEERKRYDVKLKSTRVVRERDILDPETLRRKQRLIFVRAPSGATGDYASVSGGQGIRVPLVLASSSDPACDVMHLGRRRNAELYILDGGRRLKDVVSLSVTRCRWHSFRFQGTKRVLVAITVK